MATSKVKIPFHEFTKAVTGAFPNARVQIMPIAPYVHVFDSEFVAHEFWPVWREIVIQINEKVKNRPLENNAERGICDEINTRFVAECALSTRQTYGDEDVGPGVLAASLIIPHGYNLNAVPGFGGHRTAIMAMTSDGKTWAPHFIEPQLKHGHFQTTRLPDACLAGVGLVECFV